MERLTISHFEQIKRLLTLNNLMYDDLDWDEHQLFGEFVDSELIAVAAVECYGSMALLRSVAVAEVMKGKGTGKRLVMKVEKWCQAHGITELFLLTETATPFFQKLAYKKTERDSVPQQILLTTQFAELCPASATCMKKELNQ